MTDKAIYIYKPKPTKTILWPIKPKEYKIKRNKVHRGLTYTKKRFTARWLLDIRYVSTKLRCYYSKFKNTQKKQ